MFKFYLTGEYESRSRKWHYGENLKELKLTQLFKISFRDFKVKAMPFFTTG